MRDIQVSTEVFALIWSSRKDGEDTEDAILKRVLTSPREIAIGMKSRPRGATDGLIDARFGVVFPEGFEISRTYLGENFRASIRNGQWVVKGVEGRFSTLNELSRAIGTKTENAWVNWFYRDEDGVRRPVSDLRDPEKIASKRKPASRASEKEVEMRTPDKPNPRAQTVRSWREIIRDALHELGGEAPLQDLYDVARRLRKEDGGSLTSEYKATIRRTLEDNCSGSDNFRSEDWFEMPEGKGMGVWGLRTKTAVI